MEDAKSATEAALHTVLDALNSEDVDKYVNCFHEKCVMLPYEHGVVLKGRTEVHDYVEGRLLSLVSKASLQETLDFHMMDDDHAVGCYHVDAYVKQEAAVRHFTDLIVWQKVAGAWLQLRVMFAILK